MERASHQPSSSVRMPSGGTSSDATARPSSLRSPRADRTTRCRDGPISTAARSEVPRSTSSIGPGWSFRSQERGEILVVGPEQFAGYTEPALNAAAFDEGGWFRTGDIGRVDAERVLQVTDRKKDIIIRGGENISAKEVEDALCRLPQVAEAAVTAAPDPRYGERVFAFLVLRPGVSLTLSDLPVPLRGPGPGASEDP